MYKGRGQRGGRVRRAVGEGVLQRRKGEGQVEESRFIEGWKRRVQGEVRFKERSAGCCFGGG
jgi:hypothetical protein